MFQDEIDRLTRELAEKETQRYNLMTLNMDLSHEVARLRGLIAGCLREYRENGYLSLEELNDAAKGEK